jgi:cytosine/adenosine deaminase-related metal-dependent hydrolase
MQEAGIRVVLGTDSRASNPDLCILSELQFLLRRHLELSVTDTLEMITTSAAAALGRDEFSCPVRTGHAFAATLLLCDGEQTTVDATLRAVGTRPLLAIGKSGITEADLARLVGFE